MTVDDQHNNEQEDRAVPEDKKPKPQAEYRSAGTNAALGIAAYVAVKPHVDKVVGAVVDKLKPKKD